MNVAASNSPMLRLTGMGDWRGLTSTGVGWPRSEGPGAERPGEQKQEAYQQDRQDHNTGRAAEHGPGSEPLPITVGLAAGKATERSAILATAKARSPERFSTIPDPKILTIPDAAWINQPAAKAEPEPTEAEQAA